MSAALQHTPTLCKAGPEDLSDFAELWLECVEELTHHYGEELAQKPLDYYISAFKHIVKDDACGIVVLAEVQGQNAGVLMWGESFTSIVSTKYGKVAVGFGTYVRKQFRKQGISNEMRSAAVDHLRRHKFDTLLGAVHVDNLPARMTLKNFELHQLIYTLDLSKPYKEA